jgi:TPR repeat protein
LKYARGNLKSPSFSGISELLRETEAHPLTGHDASLDMNIRHRLTLIFLLTGAAFTTATALPAPKPLYFSTLMTDRANPEISDSQKMFEQGVAFDEGICATQDYAKAMDWYKLAADNGHAEAMNRIGILYAAGRGVRQDYLTAFAWFTRAAEAGSLTALDYLSTAYFFGLGIPQSYSGAAAVLEKAVAARDPDAETRLGELYNEGLGVRQDRARARKLFLLAVQQGHTPAMINLGRAYIEGIGIRRDDIHGYALIKAAIDLGIPESMKTEAISDLNKSAARMNEKDLALAKRAAGQFLSAHTERD